MTSPLNIALLGCGKMGSAMLEAWLNAKLIKSATIIDPAEPALNDDRITYLKEANECINKTDILVLAIKPQIMSQACATIKNHVSNDTLIISIAAGQSLDNITALFENAQPIIRTMPNLPASIGKGMSVAIANESATPAQKETATDLLNALGQTQWIEDEILMHAVTALSGSGPAYLFHLIEMLASAGEKAGLEPGFAMTLTRQAIIGSAALVEASPTTPAAILRENVTSPGGTTQAALEILMNGELEEIYSKAIIAAKERSKKLASN